MLKKIIHLSLITALSAVFLCACEKKTQPSGSEKVKGSFVATIIADSGATKAPADNDGAGACVNRCKLQVWSKNPKTSNNELVYEKVAAVSGNGRQPSSEFKDIELEKGVYYIFLFWADCGNGNLADSCYGTADLHEVTIAGTYSANDDRRDAFFTSRAFTVKDGFSETVNLVRPFAQLNIITTDIKSIYEKLPAGSRDASIFNSTPSDIRVAFSAPSVFNVETGQPAGPAGSFTSDTPVYRKVDGEIAGSYTLYMDYIFAATSENKIASVEFMASNERGGMDVVKRTFTDVPLARNRRTYIIGPVLTNGECKVSVSGSWNEEPPVDPVDPTDPTDPTDPDDPADPSDGASYGQPGEPGPGIGNKPGPEW